MGIEVLAPERLARLTSTAHFVDELLNRAPDPAQPFVGKHAFAHKAGLHAAGIRADAATFEHTDPALVGNAREVLVSELSGRGTIAEKAESAGIPVDDDAAARIVERVKQLEHLGYQFEAADASFELLMRRETGAYEPLFQLESWRTIVEQRADGKVECEATVKLWIDGERYVRTAEGNGPVNALDGALRDAITEIHPHLADIELVNYKVRILDETHGTGATTRVLIDASDGEDVWGTIGVAENVIAASWQALVDSLVYREQPGRGAAPAPAAARRRRGVVNAGREVVPLARPVLGEEEERAVIEVLRSGQLSLGPRVPAFEDAFAARLGVDHASAVSSGTAGLHLALRAVGVTDGDEVVTSPFSFVASRQRRPVRTRAAGLRRHRPGDAEPRPRGGRRRDHRTHARRCFRSTSSATPPTCRPSRRSARRSSRTRARRSAPCTRTGRRSAAAATRRSSASTPTSSSPPARAGWSRWPTRR